MMSYIRIVFFVLLHRNCDFHRDWSFAVEGNLRKVQKLLHARRS